MAAKKKVIVKEEPQVTHVPVVEHFIKTEKHVVKDGQIILDPKYVNPGIFSQP